MLCEESSICKSSRVNAVRIFLPHSASTLLKVQITSAYQSAPAVSLELVDALELVDGPEQAAWLVPAFLQALEV
jgi:hypothetical protein